MTMTAVLGSEHDLALNNALFRVLRELGAEEVSRDYAVVGSQEVNTLRYTLDGHAFIVEAETYAGLSVTGDDEAVKMIASKLELAGERP